MDADLRDLDRVLKALADPTRVRIVGLLNGGGVCVCHIHETLNISQPKASRHLAYLRRAGLVEREKRGLWAYYRLAGRQDGLSQPVIDAIQHCAAHMTTVKRDAARLEKKIGCTVVAPPAPTFDGCRAP
jgi:ArsR family transcriptional regulator